MRSWLSNSFFSHSEEDFDLLRTYRKMGLIRGLKSRIWSKLRSERTSSWHQSGVFEISGRKLAFWFIFWTTKIKILLNFCPNSPNFFYQIWPNFLKFSLTFIFSQTSHGWWSHLIKNGLILKKYLKYKWLWIGITVLGRIRKKIFLHLNKR